MEIRTDPLTGRPAGEPHRLIQWADAMQRGALGHASVSADGRRLVLLRTVGETNFLVADLRDGGKRLDNTRRLSLGASEYAHAWTPDGQAVVFEIKTAMGFYNIFKQGLKQQPAEPLVTGNDDVGAGRYSPDGKWLFYLLRKHPEVRLMRIPASGGLPELVLSGTNVANYYCARLPANFCVVGENEQKQLVFYRFDPTQEPPADGIPPSRLKEVARTDYDPTDWGLSPDGRSIAMVRPDDRDGRVHIISLGSPAHRGDVKTRDVIVNGWASLYDLNWAADGKGWYITNRFATDRCAGCSFLYVDLGGRATLLQTPESSNPLWGVSSPDGRHLALVNGTQAGNAWLVENF
ncbi:MAG TPA: hypothetical protein VMT20_21095 [Terriglobia bacterium]|nr:hypothetical protein [Terriglobia bacterium]